MLPATTIRKKPKSPGVDAVSNPKTSVTCTNVPESLFESGTATKHFSKFGRLHKIRLLPKRHACIVEYEQPISAERAVLNAGAFDGFMFDVTRTKPRLRKRSTSVKKEEDPDWLPDSDVEEELSAMQGAPSSHIVTRNKSMDTTPPVTINRVILEPPPSTQTRKKLPANKTMLQKKLPVREKPVKNQPVSGIQSPMVVTTTQTTLSTSEAAAELHQLRHKVSLTPDEQWRILDARDKILRGWGGAGSRVKIGGATIGTCPDMCPEKELLHRQAEHQVMNLETLIDSDGLLEARRAVKQYSRSSADQEMPMCYELRPAAVLAMTCAYLLHEIADTNRQVTLADWFHFLWDRFRSIRKDITQQALCCAESIRLVESCARFHAHCAARLADLEHTQFDQKLNTDNLTKCLQTLKHMYADVTPDKRPRETEFRGYVALLNLGDANFWWEIKQLPLEMQKSAPIVFAIKIFNALDNNNYVKFFRLVRQEATYLQACILLRYFNDVRARALARIVKAYAPKGGARFPAEEMMNTLAFESLDKMKAFITHYGLRFGRIEENEPSIILSKHQFIEDSDPFPTARAINLIESKRQCSVGEVIAGGPLPSPDYKQHVLHTSFTKDGRLKYSSLVAEEQGFNTMNDSNKDVTLLKAELDRLARGGRATNVDMNTRISLENKLRADERREEKAPRQKPPVYAPPQTFTPDKIYIYKKLFSFKPAIVIEPTSPDNLNYAEVRKSFLFSKPQETEDANIFPAKQMAPIFGATKIFEKKPDASKGLFENKFAPPSNNSFDSKGAAAPKSLFQNTEVKGFMNASTAPEPKGLFQNSKGLFQNQQESKGLFQNKTPGSNNLFENKSSTDPKSFFGGAINEKKDPSPQNVFKSTNSEQSLFRKPEVPKTIFGQSANKPEASNKTIFGNNPLSSSKNDEDLSNNIFAAGKEKSVFGQAAASTAPAFGRGTGNIFAKATQEIQDNKQPSNIFGGFNKDSESKNIFAKSDPDSQKTVPSIFAPNGSAAPDKVSPGSLFKSVLNPPNGDDKSYSIFQSKNKAQTVADNILNSVNSNANVYEFNQDEGDQQQMRLKEEQLQQERELQRMEEERRQQELLRQKELQRQEGLRRQEEMRRQEEARKKQEELRMLEEQRKKEEQRKQEELRRKREEERIAELKRLEEEKERMFREAVNMESKKLVEELVSEINLETSREIVKEEQEKLRVLMNFANNTSEEIVSELCNEICQVEMKAEMFLTFKIMKKWYYIWRQQFYRNINRRRLLDDTPVWLPRKTPIEEATSLKRNVESAALKNMNDFHRGYTFSGEPNHIPSPQPYNLIDIIRSPLLKRMKEISYQYADCFFWKVTLVSPGEDKWLCRKINIQKWLVDAFSDNKNHEESDTLIHVGKESWNHLMEFAISVSLVNAQRMVNCGEAVEGTNGILFYATEKDYNLEESIQHTLRLKYPYQVVPVAVIMPRIEYVANVQHILSSYVENKIISGFKIFLLESGKIDEHLNAATRSALKWLAKKYPQKPPLEVDHLKSICQRYLGNEIWCRLRIDPDARMREVLRDIEKLIRCYNEAVDRLATVITDEDLFNYASFPLEFNQYLDHATPFPKSYEFIPSSARTAENASTIRDILRQLKLPNPSRNFNPISIDSMEQQVRTYCHQIGWFENPEEVVSKVVAVIPDEMTDVNMSSKDFAQYFANYNLTEFLNIIVYEKINRLNRFDDRFAIYNKSVLQDYCNIDWLYEADVISKMKHKVIDYDEDEIDYIIEAKRRKIDEESLEYLMLEDKDESLVEESIQEANTSITRLNTCLDAVKQLEKEIEDGKKKSVEFENMLRAALADV